MSTPSSHNEHVSVDGNSSIPRDLQVDASYRNTNNWKSPDDVFNKFFRLRGKGINNTSGFRPKSRHGGASDIVDAAFVLLVTNFGEPEWPDRLDRESGLFVYYGDNKKPGKLEDTALGGNRLLEHAFRQVHGRERHLVRPFLAFESFKGPNGSAMKFLGLACPGADGLSADEDLVAVWRVRDGHRFQNYRSTFTILSEGSILRAWLEDLVNGIPAVESQNCPRAWKEWVRDGRYRPLVCKTERRPRSKVDQLPAKSDLNGWRVLRFVEENLTPREFEFAAADFVQLMDSRFNELRVTRRSVDGGRDVLAYYRVGHDLHEVSLDVCIEAKHWKRCIGVGQMMRLISRLKHRDIGIFVTTSYFDSQVQAELIEDRHPVLLVSGGDIAALLVRRQLDGDGSDGSLQRWVKAIRARAADVDSPAGPVTSV